MQLFKKVDLSSCAISVKGSKNYGLSVDIKTGLISSNSGGIVFNTGDINSAKLTVMLMDGFNRYDIKHKKILCNIIRPDGTNIAVNGTVIDNGYVEFNLGYSGTCQEGLYTANISCIWKDSQLNTPTFSYRVTGTIIPSDTVQEDDRFPVLTGLIGEISDKINQLEFDMAEIDVYIRELASQITQYVEEKGLELAQELEEHKNQVNLEIEEFKSNISSEIDNYKASKDLEINSKLSEVDTKLLTVDPKLLEVDSKIEEVNEVLQGIDANVSSKLGKVDTKLEELSGKLLQADNKLSNVDTKLGQVDNKMLEVDNKVGEVNTLIESIPTTVEGKLSLVDDKLEEVTVKLAEVDPKLLEVDSKIEEVNLALGGLGSFEEQIGQLGEVNNQQDTRMTTIEDKNRVQDIYINALYNENKDKRIATTGEGNSVVLTGSSEGLVEVTKVTGNTYTNLWTGTNLNLTGGATVVNGYIDFSTQGNGYINFFFTDKSKFKPSTNYTLIADVVLNELGSNSNIVFTSNSGVNTSQKDIFTATQSNIGGGRTGKFIYKLTTKDSFDDVGNAVRAFIHNVNSGAGRRIKIGIAIIEGHIEEALAPNTQFLGMQSTFESVKVTEDMVTEGVEEEINLNKYKCELTVSDSADYTTKKAIYLTSPLLELDEILIQEDGIYHKHNCEYIDTQALSSSNVIQDSYTVNGTAYAIFKISSRRHTKDFSSCTKLKFVGSQPSQITGANQYYITGSNDFWIFMAQDTTKEAFLEFMRDTKLVASLKNPTMEKVADNKLLLDSKADVTLSTVSNIPCTSIDVTYTGNLPSIYEVEEVGVVNTKDIEVTQMALDFILMNNVSGMSMKLMRGGNNMGAYFASRILKEALTYNEVIEKYPEFKQDIDFILKSEGREDLIKE